MGDTELGAAATKLQMAPTPISTRVSARYAALAAVQRRERREGAGDQETPQRPQLGGLSSQASSPEHEARHEGIGVSQGRGKLLIADWDAGKPWFRPLGCHARTVSPG